MNSRYKFILGFLVKLLGSSCLLLVVLFTCFGCLSPEKDSGTSEIAGDNNVFPPIAQVVNNSSTGIYKVLIGNTAFILTGYGSNGGSTGFSEVPKGINNVVIYLSVGSSPITVNSLGSFLDNNMHTSAYAVNILHSGGSYSAELWQMPDTSTPFNQNNTKIFIASASTAPTNSISGVVTGAVSQGVTINLTGAATANTTTDASGNYSFSGLANGSYALTPSKNGYTFSPTSSAQTVNGENITSVNFTGTGTGVSRFDGTYTGSWSSTCPACGDGTATGTFTATLDNGVFTDISLPITSGTRSIRFDSGTVSSSGVITATGATPSTCSSSVSTITGQITTTLAGNDVMDMTYSRPRSVEGCEAEYGTITATH